jgi:hypothetical protein
MDSKLDGVLDLANRMLCAARGATEGPWRIGGSFVYAPNSADNHNGDAECYGGALVCESVVSRDLLHITMAQPKNLILVLETLLRVVSERRNDRAFIVDHKTALTHTREAVSDAVDRLDQLLKGLPR